MAGNQVKKEVILEIKADTKKAVKQVTRMSKSMRDLVKQTKMSERDITSGLAQRNIMVSKTGRLYDRMTGKTVKANKQLVNSVKKTRRSFDMAYLGMLFFGMGIQRIGNQMKTATLSTFKSISGNLNEHSVAMAKLGAHWTFLKFQVGEALASTISKITPTFIRITQAIGDFANKHPVATARIILLTEAFGGLLALFAGARLGFAALGVKTISLTSSLGMLDLRLGAAVRNLYNLITGFIALNNVQKLGVIRNMSLSVLHLAKRIALVAGLVFIVRDAWKISGGGIMNTIKLITTYIFTAFSASFQFVRVGLKELLLTFMKTLSSIIDTYNSIVPKSLSIDATAHKKTQANLERELSGGFLTTIKDEIASQVSTFQNLIGLDKAPSEISKGTLESDFLGILPRLLEGGDTPTTAQVQAPVNNTYIDMTNSVVTTEEFNEILEANKTILTDLNENKGGIQ